MIKFSEHAGSRDLQIFILRKFLSARHVSSRLTAYVMKNAEITLDEQSKHVHEKDVYLMQFISIGLQREIHFETRAPTLSAHPLFEFILHETPDLMSYICQVCVRERDVLLEGELFNRMEQGPTDEMLFVHAGTIRYLQDINGTESQEDCCFGESFCEAALWTSWSPVGTAVAIQTDALIYVVHATQFRKVDLLKLMIHS